MKGTQNSLHRYSIEGYRIKVRQSRTRVLLVEGTSDKRIFQRLFHEAEARGDASVPQDGILIDTAQCLISPDTGVMNDRQKVEAVCGGISSLEEFDHFAAFVDREFREFDLSGFHDLVGGHHVSGRLVWSRGHSIENYFFDPEMFTVAIRSAAFSESFPDACDLYVRHFVSLLRVCCAASLAGLEHDAQGLVAGSLGCDAISVRNDAVSIEIENWKKNLQARSDGDAHLVLQIISSFSRWEQKLSVAGPEFLRWVCHGHLGFETLWKAYACCLSDVSTNPTEASGPLQISETTRQNLLADVWSKRAFEGLVDFPRVVLEHLGLVSSHDRSVQ